MPKQTKATTKTKKPSAGKKKMPKTVEKVEKVEKVVEVDEVVESPTPVVDGTEKTENNQVEKDEYFNHSTEIENITTQLKSAGLIIKSLVQQVNALERKMAKDKKYAEKKIKSKPKMKNGKTPLNGFSKPGPVSDKLREFLGLKEGELIARTEVTKKITSYCQENNLQKEEDNVLS